MAAWKHPEAGSGAHEGAADRCGSCGRSDASGGPGHNGAPGRPPVSSRREGWEVEREAVALKACRIKLPKDQAITLLWLAN